MEPHFLKTAVSTLKECVAKHRKKFTMQRLASKFSKTDGETSSANKKYTALEHISASYIHYNYKNSSGQHGEVSISKVGRKSAILLVLSPYVHQRCFPKIQKGKHNK